MAGKVGLFPESYTQPAPPASEPPLGVVDLPLGLLALFTLARSTLYSDHSVLRSALLTPPPMVEYVYARYDFVPEHVDEISFCAGECIEVVEKDDIYQDGWWKVCSRSPLIN